MKIATLSSTLLLLASSVLADGHRMYGLGRHSLKSRTRRPVARTLPGERSVSIQMFQWNYDAIAAECPHIAQLGYGYVQVNPVTEHITGNSWWTDYQVVSYKIGSKHGTQAQFQNMIERCHDVGVGIILDSIWNHMSGQDGGGTGILGTPYQHYDYPGLYNYNDFHHSNTTPPCKTKDSDIHNFSDRNECQNCELSNLADLMTSTEKVRSTLAANLNALIDMGVDGFRIDAAKHVPMADLKNIISRLRPTARSGKPIYYTQEVVYEGGAGVTSAEYTSLGEVEEFRFPTALKSAFSSSFKTLDGFGKGWLPGASANVFVVNHDRERGGALSYSTPNNAYTLAHVFMLGYGYGSPTVLSSYSFKNAADGPPDNGAGRCEGNSTTGGWLCQHRWTAVSGMVGFYEAAKGQGVVGWKRDGDSHLSFFRGNAGFVAINKDKKPWTLSLSSNSLPAGKYCDVISGGTSPSNPSSCVGLTYEIPTTGKAPTLTVPAYGAIAIHTGPGSRIQDQPAIPKSVTVKFKVDAETRWGEEVYVVGNVPELGSWDIEGGLLLSADEYTPDEPVWHGQVVLPNTLAGGIEYKFVKVSDTSDTWEPTPNRVLPKSKVASVSVDETWGEV